MMPERRLSTIPVLAEFQSADALNGGLLTDYEQGGVAIGDTSQGLRVQTWELNAAGGDVRIRPYPDGVFTSFFRDAGITEIRFAFDQNMHPAFVYKTGGVWKLRWYDPTPGHGNFAVTNFPGVRDMRICLDDKRPVMRDFSDLLVFYLKDPTQQQPQGLYMRQQRDRYGVEYAIGDLPHGTNALHKVGMATNQRIRVAVWGLFAEAAQPRRPIAPYPPDVPVPNGLILDFREAQSPWYGSTGYAVFHFSFELYKPPVSDPLP